MAMGKRKPRQESLFIATDRLTQSAGHPFYQKLNALLAEADFDRWIERLPWPPTPSSRGPRQDVRPYRLMIGERGTPCVAADPG